MTRHTEAMVGTEDALRGYIRALRQLKEITQDDLGAAMQMTGRALLEYERRRTRDISAAAFLQAMQYLRAPVETLSALIGATTTEGDGRLLAVQQVAATMADGARAQLRNVLHVLEEEARSGRLSNDAYFSKAQQMLVLLGGLSTEDRQTAVSILRILAEDLEQPPQRTGVLARLFGIDTQS